MPISTDVLANGHDQDEHVHDRSDAGHELIDELHGEIAELRVALARTEERLAASERRETDLQAVLSRERTRADRLAAELAEVRKPMLVRLVEAIRRR